MVRIDPVCVAYPFLADPLAAWHRAIAAATVATRLRVIDFRWDDDRAAPTCIRWHLDGTLTRYVAAWSHISMTLLYVNVVGRTPAVARDGMLSIEAGRTALGPIVDVPGVILDKLIAYAEANP